MNTINNRIEINSKNTKSFERGKNGPKKKNKQKVIRQKQKDKNAEENEYREKRTNRIFKNKMVGLGPNI